MGYPIVVNGFIKRLESYFAPDIFVFTDEERKYINSYLKLKEA